MAQRSDTEVTTQFATTVDDLADAWAFVMEHVDKVGSAPQIHITPFWIVSNDEENGSRGFEVSVSGMIAG